MDNSEVKFFIILILAFALFAGDPDLIDSFAEFLREYHK
jgi:hypothetical protein